MDGEYLVCRGDNCPAQIKGSITRWIKKIGVLHFGDALVEALIEAEMIEDIADLYAVDPSDAADLRLASGSRVGGTASRAFKNLHKAKELDLEAFVGSLGITLIGRSMAKVIIDGGFDSLSKMYKAHPREIAAIPGVGNTKAASFCQGFWDRMPLIHRILCAGVSVKRTVIGPLTGKTLCVTGFRGQREADLKDAVANLGGTFKSGVSRALDYLICESASSTSGKPSKARQYNASGKADITIIGLLDFWLQVIGRPMP
jgi:DNA ligase (NAD+)